MKKSSVPVVLGLFAVFASGAVVGVLGERLYVVRTVAAGTAENRPTPEEWRRKYIGDLTQRLTLDGNQVTRINQILDETRDKYRAVKEHYKPEMEAIHHQQVDRISGLLSPAQKTEYDRFREENRLRKEAEAKKKKP